MPKNYEFMIQNPNFTDLGYVVAVADMNEKHDRSAPSDFHWKILKCRMVIFSNSSILGAPDRQEIKRLHIIFNKVGDDYDKLNSLFLKFSLAQEGDIKAVTEEIYERCFLYTMTAKIAPVWNTLGYNYLINNRDFLTSTTPQEGVQYKFKCNDTYSIFNIRPIKIHLIRPKETFLPGECVRVLPSLNKAVVDEHCDKMPETTKFKSYKDLRRHWKNIHGYRLPEEETTYYLLQFWRGDPLTYPSVCVTRDFPIITPLPRNNEVEIVTRLVKHLLSKMSPFLGIQLKIQQIVKDDCTIYYDSTAEKCNNTQAISLCTPTQRQ